MTVRICKPTAAVQAAAAAAASAAAAAAVAAPAAAEEGAAISGAGAGSDSSQGSGAGAAGLLAGLRQLTSLLTLELSTQDACSDAACAEYAALPHLLSLTVRRCASFGQGAPHVSDAGMRLLCSSQLGSQLTCLKLSGHAGIGDEGVRCIGRLSCLETLELRLGAW